MLIGDGFGQGTSTSAESSPVERLVQEDRQQARSLLIYTDKYAKIMDDALALRKKHLEIQAASAAAWLRAMLKKNLEKHLPN
eukprot:8471011-Karenia_brevis.AAC.1